MPGCACRSRSPHDQASPGTRELTGTLRWTERKAEWIALAFLHSGGLFTRAQLCFHIRINRWQALRFVQALVTKGFAAEDSLQDRKVCRIFSRRIYRDLGTEDSRHRRVASAEILLRRLLALDYVLEHPGLPWLPTEPEKVRAFESLGIERRHVPLRVYRGAVGEARHHFRLKLPIAVEPDRRVGTAHSEAQQQDDNRGLCHLGVDAQCRRGILSVDQDVTCPNGTRKATRGGVCTTKAFSGARRLFSILLASLRLRACRCTCRAEPGLPEVDGSAPPVRGLGSGAGQSLL